MKELDDLYPSVFKMIRARAKLVSSVRFDRKVHINVTRKLRSELERFFKKCQDSSSVSTSDFPPLHVKSREKIYYKDKKGRNHANILEMIRNDRAIIPLSKVKRLTRYFVQVPVEFDVYPIVQAFVEEQVYKQVLMLIKHVGKLKRKTIRSIHVLEI
jgi:hypothetical protein